MADAPINYGFDLHAQPLPTDVATVIGLLNSVPAMRQEIYDILGDNVLTNFLFSGRTSTTTGGFVYQTDQAQFAQTSAEDGTPAVVTTIEPGAPYTTVYTGDTVPVAGSTVKIGLSTTVERERVLAEARSPLDTALKMMKNRYSDVADSMSLAVIAAAVEQTVVGNDLSSGSATYSQITQPLAQAQTALFNNRRGWVGNAFITSASICTLISTNSALATIFALQQDKRAAIYTGATGNLNGIDIIPIPDVLCTGTALQYGGLLLDTSAFGSIAEQVALNANCVWLDSSRTPADSWFISLNHNFQQYVRSAKAACYVTGLLPS